MNTKYPFIVAIIPSKSHDEFLRETIAHLACQELEVDRIIIVDDSKDSNMKDFENPNITVLHSGGVGPYAARNLGAAYMSADFYLFLDSRSRPMKSWSLALMGEFTDPAVAAVGTSTMVSGGDSVVAQAAALEQPFRAERFTSGGLFRTYLPGCNLGVRASVFDRLGGFGVGRSGLDADLCWRILDEKAKVVMVPTVHMFWVPRARLRDYLEQHFRYGIGYQTLLLKWDQGHVDAGGITAIVRLLARTLKLGIRIIPGVLMRNTETVAREVYVLGGVAFEMGRISSFQRGGRLARHAH